MPIRIRAQKRCRAGTSLPGARFWSMPYFHFDLVHNEDYQQQGSMILEDFQAASDRADQLAAELSVVRPELRGCGCAIRVMDDYGEELYRTPLEVLPAFGTK